MGDDNATPSSTTQSHCSSDRTDQLADLDSAAASLTITLKQMEIPHVFIGGYAVSLLGGDRITEDVDVLVGQDCFDLLLDEPQFSRSSDNRLVFRHDRENVHIDIMNYDDHGFRTNPDFPLPNPANNSLILERRETSDKELVTPGKL
ncbi:hypothetical protein N7456_008088 [Penicillium angulare]|uniref:Uncharacterized protein n=1 Tax=Penicillium angulare TaxID=116970 RepID=A0A9W9K9V4_9EURO|nr:hypothetical protein N7456_008088 [Penicillium angulare]